MGSRHGPRSAIRMCGNLGDQNPAFCGKWEKRDMVCFMSLAKVPSDPLGVGGGWGSGACGSASSYPVDFRDTLLSVESCGDRWTGVSGQARRLSWIATRGQCVGGSGATPFPYKLTQLGDSGS